MGLSKPSDIAPVPQRDAGGDNEVPRDKKGRPRIIVTCWLCEGTGKRLNEKTGNQNKCTGCGPKKGDEHTADLPMGKRLKSYTRTTTYIDVIEDKSNLEAWQMRMVLIGADRDRRLLDGVADLHLEFLDADAQGDSDRAKEIKDELNRRAQVAKLTAGAEEKADKGTFLHALSELTDEGEHLPVEGVSFEDIADMDAYKRATVNFDIVHMEKLVVHDGLFIGGTPDRLSRWAGEDQLVAPDGTVIAPDDLLVTDLKSGSVEYGGLKMCMQLAIYSQSELYDFATGERSPLDKIRKDWGVIIHLPAGSGECTLLWADLTLGWRAVQVAKDVRELRSMSKASLQVIVRETAQAAAA